MRRILLTLGLIVLLLSQPATAWAGFDGRVNTAAVLNTAAMVANLRAGLAAPYRSYYGSNLGYGGYGQAYGQPIGYQGYGYGGYGYPGYNQNYNYPNANYTTCGCLSRPVYSSYGGYGYGAGPASLGGYGYPSLGLDYRTYGGLYPYSAGVFSYPNYPATPSYSLHLHQNQKIYNSYNTYSASSPAYSGYAEPTPSYSGYAEPASTYSGYAEPAASITGSIESRPSYSGYAEPTSSYSGYADPAPSYSGTTDPPASYSGYAE